MHANFPLLSSIFINSLVQRLSWLNFQPDISVSSASSSTTSQEKECVDRLPPVWPASLLIVQRRIPDKDSKVGPATTVTYYDSTQGGNLIQITPDNSSLPVLWDLELDTHHSYYFERDARTCKHVDFPVGILRRDWLRDAEPLGEMESFSSDESAHHNGPVCAWTKADFIDYYTDKETGDPVSWYFHTMKAEFRVLYYEENLEIDPSLYDPPEYCPSAA